MNTTGNHFRDVMKMVAYGVKKQYPIPFGKTNLYSSEKKMRYNIFSATRWDEGGRRYFGEKSWRRVFSMWIFVTILKEQKKIDRKKK